MKLTVSSTVIGASLFIAPSLFAQIVTTGVLGTGSLYITAPNYSAYGDQAGPYVIQNLTPASGLNPASTFQTFCIGSQVDYTPGNTYSYQISGTVQPLSGVGSPGYVTWGTAFLYNQFLSGAAGFGGTLSSDDALQAAIWELQNQPLTGITFSGPLNTTAVNQYLTDAANAAITAGISSDGNNANGAFGIYALNMYSGNTYVQPQLVQVSTPPPPTPTPVPEANTVFAGAFAGILLLGTFARNTLGKLRTVRK